jgi:uncharacterized protein YjbI with pentapeptide repeats
MANEEHLEILKKGVEAWNRWRQRNPEVVPDLRGAKLIAADFHGAHLEYAAFGWANLERANLSGADLSKADLHDAGLVMADLRDANLSAARLAGANLRWTNLARTNLRRADFRVVDLYDVDLSEASVEGLKMRGTFVADVDLSVAKGLESVLHEGPSSIGIDTIYRSKGRIPEVFLRGAGVPENFIAYMKSLAGMPSAFEYYSCFISYSTKDQEFADLLHAQLQSKGTRVWLATEDLKIGDKFRAKIDEAIRLYDKLLLVLPFRRLLFLVFLDFLVRGQLKLLRKLQKGNK